LVVAPHPDDETVSCGGAVTLHRRAGDPVAVVIVTDGGASGAALPQTRAAEAEAAAAILGGVWRRLDLPEGAWTPSTGQLWLRETLRDFGPVLVYAPSCVDFHPQHLETAHALAAALADLGHTCQVRVYESAVPLTPVLADQTAMLRDAARVKERAIAAYATQQRALQPVCRLQRYNRRLYGVPDDLEVFRELTSADYIRLMAAGRWRTASTSPFRGIRGRPFSDPLTYLVGWRARYALRAALEGAV